MAIAHVNTTAKATSTLGTLDVPYCSPVTSGNVLLMAIWNKYATGSAPSTPDGWTREAQRPGGIGSPGNDAGTGFLTLYRKESTGAESGNVTVTITGTANMIMGFMIQYSKATGSSWGFASASGVDASAGVAWSVTGDSDPGLLTGDMLLTFSGANGNLSLDFVSGSVSQSGITFGTQVERFDDNTSAGTDAAMTEYEHPVSSGTSSGNPTFTMTGSGSGASSPTGPTIFLRLREISGTTYNDAFSIAKQLSATKSVLATIAGSVSLPRTESISDSVLGTYNINIALPKINLVSLSSLASLSVSLSLIKQLFLSNAGGLSIADILAINRQVSIVSATLVSVNESFSLGKVLSISDIASAIYSTAVSLVRTESISLSSTATFEVAISLIRDLAITLIGEMQAQTYEDAFSLARSMAFSSVAGTIYEDTLSINKQLVISLLSGLLVEGAFNLIKDNFISNSVNLTLNENIGLSALFGMSDGSVTDMIGQLLLGKSLSISTNVQMTLETDVSLGTILAIQINGGQTFDEALIISIYKALAFSSSLAQFVGNIPAKIVLNDQIIWLVKAGDRLLH